ncbi:MAG: Crp/Fnr family transcriptional regulator [Acidobacteriota bacterium]|nr:Crp/Fnr family transcriptional regulator [Acidobacteriota bacterium]
MSQSPAAIETLRRVPLFANLSPDELDFIAHRAVPRRCDAGEMIFSEGEPCKGLFVVQSGQVKIFKTSPDGREQVLLIAGPGSTMAELPVFDGGPYPASASAVTEAALLEVRKEDVRQLCLEHPKVALKLLRVVGARLRRLVAMIEELSFTTVRQRLAALLVREAEANGRPTPRGIEFDLPWTHQELAAQIGTVRELVSRNLSRLQSTGTIHIEGRKVLVTDKKSLEAESQP